MALMPNLMHRLHGEYRSVRRREFLTPIRSLEVSFDESRRFESRKAFSAQLQHVLRKIEQRVALHVRTAFEDRLRQVSGSRPQLEHFRSRWESTNKISEPSTHWIAPRFVNLAGRNPGTDLLSVEKVDSRRNVNARIGVVNGHEMECLIGL